MKRSPSHLAPLLAAFCALATACESDYEKLTDDLKGPGPNKIVDAGKPPDTTPTPLPEASTHEAGSADGAAPEGGSAGDGGQDAASNGTDAGGGDGSTGDASASDASADAAG